MQRRGFLAIVGGAAVAAVLWRRSQPVQAESSPSRAAPAVDRPEQPTTIEPVELGDAEWRERLTKQQYRILREEGTERAGTSPLNDEKRQGDYLCAGCGLLLFRSDWKYDSGTGWPSFYEVIAEHIGTKADRKLWYERTEYHCARCGGHQGHVFEDGPEPTGLRYCNNGLALVFEPDNA